MPEQRAMIKLQPILNPVKVPDLNQRPQLPFAIQNGKQVLENKMFEHETFTQENAILQNAKPAPDNVPPSTKEWQKVLVPSAKEVQNVFVSDNK